MIALRLLGGVSLEDERGRIGSRAAQRRRLALLALLARAGPRGWSRDKLLALLWPDAGTTQARHLLSDSIHVIRHELGEDTVIATGDTLRLNPERVICDANRFEAALDGRDPEAAVGVYAGDFLDGFFISGAPEFEHWVATEREMLARKHADALATLAAEAFGRDAPSEAAGWLRRLVERDSGNTRAVLDLMRALEANGDRTGAIASAERHQAYLREELDAEPDPVVTEQVRRLRSAPTQWMELARRPRLEPPAWTPSEAHVALPSKKSEKADRKVAWVASAALVLAVFGSWAAWPRPAADLTPEEVLAAGAAPGIAVLPFTVNDPSLDRWREGMVDLLSVTLDGVPDLRAIDNRTVLARWGETVPDTARADLATALEVARETGARYALVGTVVTAGSDLRLTADVYEARGGAKVVRAHVVGAPDSIIGLVNRLTMEILTALPREGSVLADVDLAEVTTDSLAALKAFLNGEALYRRADFKGAAAEFERAIVSDSTFALAWDGLYRTCGWHSGSKLCERVPPWWPEPDEFLSRLPARKAELMRAGPAFQELRPLEVILEALQQVVRKYPDDPEAWYLLGDMYVHQGGAALVDRAEADRALSRAIALAPTTSAEPYIHLIEHAFADADSARVARLLNGYERITHGADTGFAAFRLAFALGFGDRATRARARAVLDTVATQTLFLAVDLLGNPRLHGASEEALRIALARPDPRGWPSLWILYRRGNLLAALGRTNDPAMPPATRARFHYRLYQVGVSLPSEELARTLAAGAADTTKSWPVPTFLLVGAYAVDRGQWDEYAAALDRERARARRHLAEGDVDYARDNEGAAHAMEGYALWKRGRKEEAIRALEAAQQQINGFGPAPFFPNVTVRWWLGELMLEVGRPRDAERYFKSLPGDPFAALRLGKVYEQLGEREKARASYEYALLSWQDADPELAPHIQAARAALAALGR